MAAANVIWRGWPAPAHPVARRALARRAAARRPKRSPRTSSPACTTGRSDQVSFVQHLHAHDALVVSVFAVIVADELHHLVVRQASIVQRVRDRFLEHDGVVERDLIPKNIRRYQREALGDPKLWTV